MSQPALPVQNEPRTQARRRTPKWVPQPLEGAPNESQYRLRSIARAVDVLNCFDGHNQLSLSDVASLIPLPRATLYRVLLTLEESACLLRNLDGTYRLTSKLAFGWLANSGNEMRDIARPELEHLTSQFSETANLAYLFEDRIHVLDSIESFHEIRISHRIGRLLPPHCTALGKVIAAFQDRPLVDRILETYGLSPRTDNTIVERLELLKEFQKIRETGIACDLEEFVSGVVCFAAAVHTEGSPVLAAISVSVPTMRLTAKREGEIQAAIHAAASRIANLSKSLAPIISNVAKM